MKKNQENPASVVFFRFETNQIRVIQKPNGDVWFVASDVCEALTIYKVDRALSRLDEDERGAHTVSTLGGSQKVSVINESGLYSLILTSRKPEAKKFKKWVTSEVLPAIRKTGYYSAQKAPGPASEPFSRSDMQNLQRMVWLVTNCLRNKPAGIRAVWHDLRCVTGNPAPNRFQVWHIPLIAAEIRYIYCVTKVLSDTIAEAENMVIEKILRQGEIAKNVLAETRTQLAKATEREVDELNVLLDQWGEQQIMLFMGRETSGASPNYGTQELLDILDVYSKAEAQRRFNKPSADALAPQVETELTVNLRSRINRRAYQDALKQYYLIKTFLIALVKDNLAHGATEAACEKEIDTIGDQPIE